MMERKNIFRRSVSLLLVLLLLFSELAPLGVQKVYATDSPDIVVVTPSPSPVPTAAPVVPSTAPATASVTEATTPPRVGDNGNSGAHNGSRGDDRTHGDA